MLLFSSFWALNLSIFESKQRGERGGTREIRIPFNSKCCRQWPKYLKLHKLFSRLTYKKPFIWFILSFPYPSSVVLLHFTMKIMFTLSFTLDDGGNWIFFGNGSEFLAFLDVVVVVAKVKSLMLKDNNKNILVDIEKGYRAKYQIFSIKNFKLQKTARNFISFFTILCVFFFSWMFLCCCTDKDNRSQTSIMKLNVTENKQEK